MPDHPAIIATRHWLQRAVIGLNLCPFAAVPLAAGRLRIALSTARDPAELADDLRRELEQLRDSPVDAIETTLLVHPQVLTEFHDYNRFLAGTARLLRKLGLDGEIQIASFHPDYCFADATTDDVGNCTNRSPHPTLHLLRESSVDRAVAAVPDTDRIYQRNIETLQRLGHAGWQALMRNDDEADRTPDSAS